MAGYYDYTYIFSSMHKYQVNHLYFFPFVSYFVPFFKEHYYELILEEEASNVFSGKVTYMTCLLLARTMHSHKLFLKYS